MYWQLTGIFAPFVIAGTYIAFVGCAMWSALLQPWMGFTFTDTVDFVIPTLIVGTVVGIVALQRQLPHERRKAQFLKCLLFGVDIATPLPFLGALYAQWSRATHILGHPPRSLIEDPRLIGGDDPTYQQLCYLTSYAHAVSGWLLYVSLGLLFHLWSLFSIKEKVAYSLMIFGGWWIISGNEWFLWWLD